MRKRERERERPLPKLEPEACFGHVLLPNTLAGGVQGDFSDTRTESRRPLLQIVRVIVLVFCTQSIVTISLRWAYTRLRFFYFWRGRGQL